MVLSLKRAHSHRLDLYIGSRDFLRIFTDAANHIPRHRRTKFVETNRIRNIILTKPHSFFAHLVDVLGSDDFLAPVCMLLIEKVANRVVRQNVADIQSSLALPISILQHYPPSLQNFVSVFDTSPTICSSRYHRSSQNYCGKANVSRLVLSNPRHCNRPF